MSLKFENKSSAILVFIILLIVTLGISYFCTVGMIWLICKCFSWAFSWKFATGIWLVLFLVGSTIKSNITVKK